MPRVKQSDARAARAAAAIVASKKKRRDKGQTFAKRVLSIVHKGNPSEVKYADSKTLTGAPVSLVSNTFYSTLLNGISTGTDELSRVGMKVNNLYLQIRATVYQAVGAVSPNVRFIVMQSEVNSATPTALDVLEYTSSLSATEITRKADYKILRDELRAINFYDGDSNVIDWYIPLRNLKLDQTYYNGTGNTIASISKGSLWFIVMSDTAITASLAVGSGRAGLEYYCRFAYTDP